MIRVRKDIYLVSPYVQTEGAAAAKEIGKLFSQMVAVEEAHYIKFSNIHIRTEDELDDGEESLMKPQRQRYILTAEEKHQFKMGDLI
jgi:hypothetical protein